MNKTHVDARKLQNLLGGKYHDNLTIAIKIRGMKSRICKIEDINWIMANVPHDWVDLSSVKDMHKDHRYLLVGGIASISVCHYYGPDV